MARLGATVVATALLVSVLACSLSACDAARPKGFVTPKKVGRFMKWFREEGVFAFVCNALCVCVCNNVLVKNV